MTKSALISLLSIVFILPTIDLFAQVKKPTELSVSLYSTLATQEVQPLWLSANREGIFEEFSKANGVISFRASSKLDHEKLFDYSYGVNVITRAAESSSELFMNEIYVTAKASILQLDVGRKSRITAETKTDLSSGSLGIGRNATPIPMINISVPDFTPVPFTQNLLKFKGNLAHGWLGEDRFVKNTFLHEKSFYLKGGTADWPVQFYTGLINFAQWGGTSSNPNVGKLPSSFNDYISVIFGKGGGSDSPGGEQINALGNHLGIWDYGIDLNYSSLKLKIYYQHPFEDNSGLFIRSLEDGLWGIHLTQEKPALISGFVWEFLYTKSQSGPGLTDPPGDFPFCEEENCGYPYGGRDNYYNNFIYNSGWSYNGRTLGTPLFLTVAQTRNFIPGITTRHNLDTAIESNRLVAHHFGFEGHIIPEISYKTFVTYARHYGNYFALNNGFRGFDSKNPDYDKSQYEFYPALHQWSLMTEFAYSFKQLPDILFTTTVAYDTGDLTNNAGILMGATWKF